MKNDLKEITAKSSASIELGENSLAAPSQRNLISNWRGFIVLLPGLCTLVIWEVAAWQWPGVAKLVSQPTEIARGIVDVIVTGTIWQHLDATLREMAAG
ncbi:MAG TPA: hypothetical protein VGA27_09030, partial [Candidatus Binatia bacterium]